MTEEQEIYKRKVFPALRSQAILFYFGKKIINFSVFRNDWKNKGELFK